VYEPEGVWPEDGPRYLPDFELPGPDCYFEVKSDLPTHEAILRCHALADETGKRVAMAHSSPGLETLVYCFAPRWRGYDTMTVPAFFMQWLRPERVLAAIEAAQSARFEFGETPNVVPLRLAAPKSQTEPLPF
jgi:hypothetical protein